jgi:transposase
MNPPKYVRELTPEERIQLEAALRSSSAFTLRRAQIVLASARREPPARIASALGCSAQTVRNAIRAFEADPAGSLVQQSSRPKLIESALDEPRRARLQHLLHQSPRHFGRARSVWTLALAAEVCAEQGITPERMSTETIRRALKLLGTSWKRAKHWITSPDPLYAVKKSSGTG